MASKCLIPPKSKSVSSLTSNGVKHALEMTALSWGLSVFVNKVLNYVETNTKAAKRLDLYLCAFGVSLLKPAQSNRVTELAV